MLSALYSLLLRLRRRVFPHATAEEMTEVFAAAREDAWRRGPGAYVRFALRELGGLIGPRAALAPAVRTHKPVRWVVAGALIGAGVALGALLLTPPNFRSEGKLRVVPGLLPERYISSSGGIDLEQLLRSQRWTILSRHTLTNVIRTYHLYSGEQQRLPLEDVVERMRRDITLQLNADGTYTISFSYCTPEGAQKVARDLMTRVIDYSMRDQSVRRTLVVQFLSDRSEAAAKAWIEQEARLHSLRPGDQAWTRAKMDADLAKREYVALREKVGEARMAESAAVSKFDTTLEVLDLPSLPARGDRDDLRLTMLGAALGGVLGGMVAWVRSLRHLGVLASSPTSA